MFLIIGVWGGERRIYATFKFFLYTLLGSVFMLLGVIVLWQHAGSSYIPDLTELSLPLGLQKWLWLAFFVSFAVKIPMVPLHTWLPDAHVEAPTAGSVILAGVLLKLGGYGLLRFSLPIMPEASAYFTPFVFVLSGVAVAYASLAALVQEDMKKLVAYSSVAHMGFVTAGMFSATPAGLSGAVIQMLSHGLISSALFLCVGVLYDRLHTRRLDAYGGVAARMPFYAFLLVVFALGSAALPGTSGFIGEFLVLLGVWSSWPESSSSMGQWATVLLITGMVLGAAYMLWLVRRVCFGQASASIEKLRTLDVREKIVLVPLALIVLWMGLYPTPFIAPLTPALEAILVQFNAGLVAVR